MLIVQNLGEWKSREKKLNNITQLRPDRATIFSSSLFSMNLFVHILEYSIKLYAVYCSFKCF